MKAVIVTCFKSNEERINFVRSVFLSKGFDVDVITTDFDHIKHKKRETYPEGYLCMPTEKYKRNISIKRLMSHSQFAIDAFFMVEDLKPDVIWLLAPCNSLVKRAYSYKKRYPNVKLIIDIIDMWPESLPTSINKDFLPFKLWKNRRSRYIKVADALVSECDFYKDILSQEYDKNITTIHWARNEDIQEPVLDLPEDKISLCYLGSINNIINIDLIKKIIVRMDKPVILHVIGDGENRKNFVKNCTEVCEVVEHGEVRDSAQKAEIIKKCHAGLNLYREGLYIGLTVKSIDYLQYGLPIINNIQGDTYQMIQDYPIGFNVEENSKLSSQDIIRMRRDNQPIYDLYHQKFTKKVFLEKCSNVIDEVLSK